MSSIKKESPFPFEKYSPDIRESILEYLAQLNEKEQIAYTIAKDHLGTSFNIIKSIGYMEWKKKGKQKEKETS
jgi:hypothetical protein